jgi:alkylation response protein AidB-like acyl-CoA dehydrogenase
MNFEYSEEQNAILDVVRTFCKAEIEPNIEYIERENHMPENFAKKMGDAGLMGITLPEEYGGMAMSHDCLMAAMIEMARTSAAATCFLISHLSGMEIIRKHGPAELKDKYVAAAAAGDIVTCMAFTEPGTGGDPKQLVTTAREEGDHIILNGVKRFITNASYPGPMVVWAKDAETGNCSAYVIDKFCKGFSLSNPWEKVGMMGSPVFDVFLDDVTIPKSSLLGAKGEGFEILLSESSVGKMSHAAIAAGLKEAARARAVRYANEKLPRGKPISEKFQAIQLKLAKICEQSESAKWMIYRCAHYADEGTDTPDFKAYASLVKGYAADLAPEVILMAMNVLGPYGTMEEYSVERYMRDALIGPHIEVVSDVQRVIYAKYITDRMK